MTDSQSFEDFAAEGGDEEPTVTKVADADDAADAEPAAVVNAAEEPPGENEDVSEERTDARGRKLGAHEVSPPRLEN